MFFLYFYPKLTAELLHGTPPSAPLHQLLRGGKRFCQKPNQGEGYFFLLIPYLQKQTASGIWQGGAITPTKKKLDLPQRIFPPPTRFLQGFLPLPLCLLPPLGGALKGVEGALLPHPSWFRDDSFPPPPWWNGIAPRGGGLHPKMVAIIFHGGHAG